MAKMTKILVFSDSHGRTGDMQYIIDRVHPDAEYVLHLGDGEADAERLSEEFPRQAFVTVRGNRDWGFGDSNLQRVLEIEGVRIFMCHGHKNDVYSGTRVIASFANSRNCDIALYGHTHYSEYVTVPKPGTDGRVLHILNPGSVTVPRGGQTVKGKSYGVIMLDGNGGIEISIYAV